MLGFLIYIHILLQSVHSKVRLRILEFIQMCSFEFRADSTLGLMNEVYQSLRAEGIQFPSPQKPKKEFTQVYKLTSCLTFFVNLFE
jgi:hypothetical protein